MIWSLIASVISLGISFFMTPYISERLGIEAYGFITLGNTVISYINIISAAINSYAARYIGVHYHRGELDKANSYYGSVLIANILLSISALAIGGFLILKLNMLINIPDNLIGSVKLLFFVVLINYFLNLIGATFSSVMFIKNMASITSRINSYSSVIYAGILLGGIYFGTIRVYSMAIAHLIAYGFVLICNLKISRRVAPELIPRIKSSSGSYIKILASAGMYNSINYLGGTLGSGLDLLVTNICLSNTIMGQISVCQQIGGIIGTVYNAFSGAFQPKELEAYSRKDNKMLIRYLRFNMQLTGAIGNVFFFGFLFLGKGFFKLWMPEEDYAYLYQITVIILIGHLLVSIVTPLWYVFTLTVKMRTICITTVLCGMANVLSMMVLLKITTFGGYIVVGTTAALDLVSVIQCPYLCKKYLEIENDPFIIDILKHFGVAIFFSIVYVFIGHDFFFYNWCQFLWYGIAFAIISFLVCYLVQFDRTGRVLLKNFIKEKVHKRLN
jgi:O-antigen/teichoic acid export membrane protein